MSGDRQALLVLVALASEHELAALEATLADEGQGAALEALTMARQQNLADIDAYVC